MPAARLILNAAILGAVLLAGPARAAPMPIPAAVADPARPAEQRAVDDLRKPAAILALSEVKAGDRMADIGPGGGYYTRLFSRVVGESGKVYAFNPDWVVKMFPTAGELAAKLAAAGYTNVEARVQPMAEIAFEAPLDVVFISQLYHDQHWQQVDIARMNAAIWRALKPGGVFFIIDHRAAAGATDTDIAKLHRIDPAVVQREVEAAGFVLDTASDVLDNASDPLTANVFDASIKGRTSQFVLKFRKPPQQP